MKDFKVYWDLENNVPAIIDEQMDDLRIKSEKLKYMTTDLRPVFLKEKHLIKHLFEFEDYIYYSSVWSTKQGKYIIDGKALKKSVISTAKGIEDIDAFRKNILSFEPTKEMEENEKNIIKKFIEINKNHIFYLLESKDIDEEGHTVGAYPFVNEVIKKYSKRVPMVSFSGGKDSTVVSYIVRKALNNPSILHIFGDTTLELPETYQYVKKFKKDNPMTPFFEEKNEENDFFEMCKEIGPPSRVKSWCCSIFKTGPMGTTLSNFEEDFLTFYGVRRNESSTRSQYKKVSLTPKMQGGMVTSPIIDWLDIDVWLYILGEKIKYNEAYNNGFPRVGCWVCPNNSYWSQFLAKIYLSKDKNKNLSFDYKEWENYIYDFSKKIVKDYLDKNNKNYTQKKYLKAVDYYVKEDKWKARQGGSGLEKSLNTIINSKECINEANSYNIKLNRILDKEFIELLKPFGKLKHNYHKDINEILVISKKGNALFKVSFKFNKINIKITIIDFSDRYLYGKIIKQLNKFNSCMYCQACNSTCKVGAITVSNGQYKIDEDKCVHCLNCVNRFQTGCIISSALKIKK